MIKIFKIILCVQILFLFYFYLFLSHIIYLSFIIDYIKKENSIYNV